MIDRIRALLSGQRLPKSAAGGGEADELHLAAAALLVEAGMMDGSFDADERTTVERLLAEYFGLNGEEVTELVRLAEEKIEGAVEIYRFTRVVKDRFSEEERVRMMEMLWEVAYADGHLHAHEANLARRVAGLIFVSDRDSGAARKRVLSKLGLSPD